MKRDIRSDYARNCPDMAFPKKVRIKEKAKKPEVKEDVLQTYCNTLLKLKHIPFLRLSSSTFRAIFANPSIPVWIKTRIKIDIAGWADNLAILPIDEKYNLLMCLELKTETGKLHGMQKDRAKEMAVQVARSHEEIDKAIKDFEDRARVYKRDIERCKQSEIDEKDIPFKP